MGGPAVSVVVASWAGPGLLPRTLSRVREQADEVGAELLLVVNRTRGEVDAELLARCEELAHRVLFEERPGKSRALNRGVAAARGQVCAFVDDDALPEPGWLAALLAPFEADPACAGVGGRVLPELPADGVPRWYRRLTAGRETFFLGPCHDLGDAPRDYAPGAFATLPLGTSCAYRRERLVEVGYALDLGPNREGGTRGGEDALLARTLLDGGHRLVYAPGAVVRHPVAPERITARYVLEGYYWQGVERVRILRHLGLELTPQLLRKARRILWCTTPLAWLAPWLPAASRVRLLKRRERHRGLLDEVAGRVSGTSALMTLACAALVLAATQPPGG